MHGHVETRGGTLHFAIDVAQTIASLDQLYLKVALSFSADLTLIDVCGTGRSGLVRISLNVSFHFQSKTKFRL